MIRLAGLVWVWLAFPAFGHGNLPGSGGFASGFAHPFVAVEHAMAIGALGLLCGPVGLRLPAFWLICGLALGLGLDGTGFTSAQAAILGLALLTGLTLTFVVPVSSLAVSAVSFVLGLLIGLQTDQPLTSISPFFAHAGAITAALLIYLNGMAAGTWLRARGNGVPLRVAGAWVSAASIMILAFLVRERLGIT